MTSLQTRNSLHALTGGMIWSTIGTVFLVVSGLGLNLIVGNQFGDSGLGVYALATSIYLFIGSLSVIGQPAALVKYTAEFTDEPETGRQYFTASAIFVCVSCTLAGGILVAIKGTLSRLLNMPELAGLLPILAIALPLFGLNKAIIARLNGQRLMRTMTIVESMRYVLIILLTWCMTQLLSGKLVASIWPFLIAEVGLLIALWFVARLRSSFSLVGFGPRLRELTWFGMQVALARLMGELSGRLDLFLAGYFLTPGNVGVYAVALMFGQCLNIVPAAIQKVTYPVLADLYARKQIASMEHFVNQVMHLTMLSLVLLAVLMVVFFQPIVALMYPGQDSFLNAQGAFSVLAVGFIFRGVAITAAAAYSSAGRPDIELKFTPVLPVANFIVSVLLVNPFKMIGIAAGAATSSLIIFVVWTALLRPVVGIRVDYKPLFLFPLIGLLMMLAIHLLEPYVPPVISTTFLVGGFALAAIRWRRLDQYILRLLHRPESATTGTDISREAHFDH